MSIRKAILVALATVVIFAAGVVTGGLLVSKTRPRPSVTSGGLPFLGRVEAIGRAASQLDLSPDQRQRIADIVRNGRERMADYFMILEPDIQQVFREMRQQIHAELTSAQRAEFDELFRDGKSQAKPPLVTADPGISLPEALEDTRECPGADPLARVAHDDLGARGSIAEDDRDPAAFGCELDRIS